MSNIVAKRSTYERLERRAWLLPVLSWVTLVCIGLAATGEYGQRQLILIAIYCLAAAGLNLSFGYGGELALGQVAVMAAGAYTTAILANDGHTSLLFQLAMSVAVAAVLGFVTGVPGLRVSRWALGLVSFFLVLLLPGLVAATREHSGGLEGLIVPRATIFGSEIDTTEKLFVITLVIVGIWFLVFRNLIRSRYGMALRAYRESPVLLESLGQSSVRLKLSAYVVGSLPAGAAGCLYAHLSSYISPTSFTMALTLAVLAATVLGGADSIYGALFGATVLVLGPLQAQEFQAYSVMAYGGFLLLIGVLLRDGIAGLVRDGLAIVRRRLDGTLAPISRTGTVADLGNIDGKELAVTGATVEFGAFRAVDNVSMIARPGAVTAIIGSNGAGKTTLLNAISGFQTARTGTITIDGRRLDGMSAAQVARSGVARGFQTPLVPRGATFADVVGNGRMRADRMGLVSAALRLPRFRDRQRGDEAEARRLLDMTGLGHLAHTPASEAPLGTRRLLEVLRATAGNPHVILMDEPAAGLDDGSLEALRVLIGQLRDAGATVVLIEHNVPFVLGLADHVVVLEAGSVLATGTADEIRHNDRVIDSYLGRRSARDEAIPVEVGSGWQ